MTQENRNVTYMFMCSVSMCNVHVQYFYEPHTPDLIPNGWQAADHQGEERGLNK